MNPRAGLSVDGVSDGLVGAAVGTARAQLPRVLHDAPAAVLLVDTVARRVLHANPAARDLLGPRALPLGLEDLEALLLRVDGTRFAAGTSPVERAVTGTVVFGETIRLVSDGGLRPVWASAVPLPGSGDLPEQVLLVMFDIDPAGADEIVLRERAVVAAGLSFTIADPRLPDTPLVYVNPAFERTTGYAATEAVGRNCRFLQGPDTDPDVLEDLRAALREERSTVLTLLNYRKDGSAFWNELSVSPVYDADGGLTHFVGIQADVTVRVLAEDERLRHLTAERAARADAERAQARLALLAEATSMLAATLDVEESLRRLTDLAVPVLADFCTIDLVELDGSSRRVSSRHHDPTMIELLKIVEERQPKGINDRSATAQVLAGGPPVLLPQVSQAHIDAAVEDKILADAYHRLGMRSAIVVPLDARRQVLGVLALFTSDSGRTYDQDDLATAADLARRAALTLDNARIFQREHDVAEALQRSLLPTLPDVPGLDRAARYLPSSAASQVGGDWYDLLQLPDGTVGMAIGDVMGHDISAAAAMGQLRSVLRSYAWQGESPAQVLDHLDQLVQGLGMAQLATAVYARLQLGPDGADFRYANAGHLPPLVRTPDGQVRFLRDARSLLVGAAPDFERSEARELLPTGSVVVLYTDGLVEDRERDLDDGLALLAEALRVGPDDAEGICDALTDALSTAARADDVALLVVKVL